MVMTENPPGITDDIAATTARRRKPWLLAAGALVAVAVVVAVFVVLDGDDDDPSPPPSTSALPDALTDGPTDPDTVELLELLADGRTATYRAVYQSSGADDEVTLELWRRDGLLRQDSLIVTGDVSVQTSSFILDGAAFLCSLLPGQDWVCSEGSEASADAVDGVFGSVQDQLAGSQVSARDGELDGREVRCFVYSGAEASGGEICVSTEGIPVRIRSEELTIELSELEGEVGDGVFDLPAEPVQE